MGGDVMSIIYILAGSVALGLLTEFLRALIWGAVFYAVGKRLLRRFFREDYW